MGQLTLKRFQALILANPGFQGKGEIDKGLVKDWINLAYNEVVGAVDFDAFKRSASLTTIDGVSEYLFPGTYVAMIGIQDRTTGTNLVRTSLRDAQRRTFSSTGYPRYYAVKGNGIVLWPTPNAEYSLFAYFVGGVTPLEEPDDKTEIAATWDKAILLLATESGLRNYNLSAEADSQFTRAMAFMRSRVKDEDMAPPAEGPLMIARSWEDIFLNRPDSEAW